MYSHSKNQLGLQVHLPPYKNTLSRTPKTAMTRDISPPPSKRQKLSPNAGTTSAQTSPLPPPSQVPPEPPTKGTLRLFSWNVNGINPFLQSQTQKTLTSYFETSQARNSEGASRSSDPPASLRHVLRRHHWPSILFLQEVKIAPEDAKTQDAVRRAVNRRLPSEDTRNETKGPLYDVYFKLPTDRINARGLGVTGKVYGIASIVRSDLAADCGVTVAHRTVDWDNEGRVSVIEMTTPESSAETIPSSTISRIAFFNIYAVNGTSSPYKHSRTGAVVGTRHDRKLGLQRHLMEECVKLEKEGWHIVLAGDFNVAPRRIDGWPKLRTWPYQHVLNRQDFLEKLMGEANPGQASKAQDTKSKRPVLPDVPSNEQAVAVQHFEGIDVWRRANPTSLRFTYFPRGRAWGSSCDRVDYVLASKKLWDAGRVTAAGILDNEVDRGPSDHVPIWVDIRLTD